MGIKSGERRFHITRPSPAMVVALIALFVSLAGNAAAGAVLITSRDIKNGTIQVVDLNTSARAALKGKRGLPGLEGLRGQDGAAGVAGARGLQGTTGQGFPKYSIESDLGDLCRAMKQVQTEIDNMSTSSVFWLPSFKYRSCLYFY